MQSPVYDGSISRLTSSRDLYSEARSEALEELYKSKELDRSRPESIEADFEEVAASCGHFSFSLQDFAHEMQNYLGILEDLKVITEEQKKRSWSWTRFWRKDGMQLPIENSTESEQEPLALSIDDRNVPKDFTETASDRAAAQSLKVAAEETPSKQRMYKVFLRVVRTFERNDSEYLQVANTSTLIDFS
jgi:hypothetical protein